MKDFSDRWSQTTRSNIAAMKLLGRKANENEGALFAHVRSLTGLRGAFEAVGSEQARVDAALNRLAADQLSLESALDSIDRELAKVLENRLPGNVFKREGLVRKAQELLRRTKTQDHELSRALADLNGGTQRVGSARETEPRLDATLALLLNHFHQSIALLELRLQEVHQQLSRLDSGF